MSGTYMYMYTDGGGGGGGGVGEGLSMFFTIIRTYNWGERERAPSCGLNGRAITIYIILYVRHVTIYIYVIFIAHFAGIKCFNVRARG